MFNPASAIFMAVLLYWYPLKFQLGLRSGNLLRFAIDDGGLSFVDGRLDKADLHYLGKPNRARAFADSCSKVGSTLYAWISRSCHGSHH